MGKEVWNMTGEENTILKEAAEVIATSVNVMNVMNELPDITRIMVMAFYYDNMTTEEIAEVFECSVNTVKNRLCDAKRFLSNRLEGGEKKKGDNVHDFSPMLLLCAFKCLFLKDEYVLSDMQVQNIYNSLCINLGLQPTVIYRINNREEDRYEATNG